MAGAALAMVGAAGVERGGAVVVVVVAGFTVVGGQGVVDPGWADLVPVWPVGEGLVPGRLVVVDGAGVALALVELEQPPDDVEPDLGEVVVVVVAPGRVVVGALAVPGFAVAAGWVVVVAGLVGWGRPDPRSCWRDWRRLGTGALVTGGELAPAACRGA